MNPILHEDLNVILQEPLPWDRLEGKTTLITGANGLLASYLVFALLLWNDSRSPKRKTKVVGVVRNRAKARQRFQGFLDRDDFQIVESDLGQDLAWSGAADFVVHCASQASPRFYGKDPVGTFLPNVVGTWKLLELARVRHAESFLFVSSGEVYGVLDPTRIPMGEEDYGMVDPLAVRSCYAEGKRAGESLCTSYAHQFGVSAKVVRPFHTYGPGMNLAEDGRVFADFVGDVVHQRDIALHSDGSARRAYCYISDAVRGFFAVLFKGEKGIGYNVGNPDAECSVVEFAEVLIGLFPEKNLKIVRQQKDRGAGYLESPVSRNCPRIDRLQKLGWGPRVSLREGLRRTVESYSNRDSDRWET